MTPDVADRFGPAWGLALLCLGLAAVLVLARVLRRLQPAAPPSAPDPGDDGGEPECSVRTCAAPATRARPRLRTSRPLGLIVPLRSVETDPDGEPCLCAVHHGAVVATLTERITAEGAALEAHLAARARALVDFELVELPRLHGIAPAARPPSPLRAPTPAPTGAPEAPAAVEAAPAEAPG